MSELQTKFSTDTWVVASWDEYIQTIKNPAYEKAKCYYHNGQLRIDSSISAITYGIIPFL